MCIIFKICYRILKISKIDNRKHTGNKCQILLEISILVGKLIKYWHSLFLCSHLVLQFHISIYSMHKLEETIPYAFPIYLKCWQQSVENSFSENPHLHIYCKQWNPANMQSLYLMLFVSRVFNTMHILLWVAYDKFAHKKITLKACLWSWKNFRLRYFPIFYLQHHLRQIKHCLEYDVWFS